MWIRYSHLSLHQSEVELQFFILSELSNLGNVIFRSRGSFKESVLLLSPYRKQSKRAGNTLKL